MFLKTLFFKRLVVMGPDETPVRVPKALNLLVYNGWVRMVLLFNIHMMMKTQMELAKYPYISPLKIQQIKTIFSFNPSPSPNFIPTIYLYRVTIDIQTEASLVIISNLRFIFKAPRTKLPSQSSLSKPEVLFNAK